MYMSYIQLIREFFPNGKIIINLFHNIQFLSHSLNKTRTPLINHDKANYNKLKRYWKQILKYHCDLDRIEFKPRNCFKQ